MVARLLLAVLLITCGLVPFSELRSANARGSASASRQLGYLSPEASLSAMLGVEAGGGCLVCLESTKVLDA
jgi:uncharacterized membrane protein YphA (DoxX/SURF4 family)